MPGRTFSDARRLRTIDPIVRRLRPDILLPARGSVRRRHARRGPACAGVLGELPHARGGDREARSPARRAIGVSASAYDSRDSTLYAWAAAPDSPVDVVGFTLFPSRERRPHARRRNAARPIAGCASRDSPKEHWVFAAGGYPEAHGEASQERAVWAALAWATSRPSIKGLIVSEAGDYGSITGLRAADGHLRRARRSP